MSMADRIAVLREGKVEQVASPEELFDRPTSRFVAEFIGTTNMFETSERVMSVRPHRMRLVDAGGSTGDAQLRGRVRDVQFYGGVSHCIIDVVAGPPGSPTTVVVAVIGSTDVDRGDDVTVTWSHHHEMELER